MKRKPGTLLPIEVSILRAGSLLFSDGTPEFHGYAAAKMMHEAEAGRQLTAHGTLYRALARMEEAGLLESRWEEPSMESEGRPQRRLYRLTAVGEKTLQAAGAEEETKRTTLRRGLAAT